MEQSVAQTPTTGEPKINLGLQGGGVNDGILRFYTATLELKFNTRNMSNFDGMFETVESLWANLSRNLEDIRYETEGLDRDYSELLTLLGVSDHKSAIEAIISLKSKRDITVTSERIRSSSTKSVSKATNTYRDLVDLS